MNKDKQIEEMCEVLRKNAASCQTCVLYAEGFCIGNCELAEDNQTVCETLYNAGYRRASEVALEAVDDFQIRLRNIFCTMCNDNDYNTVCLLEIDSAIECLFDVFVAELKKKYTEDKK